jgi:hypothetical protein
VLAVLLGFLVALPPVAADEATSSSPLVEPPFTDFDREHWAFRPLVRPAVPAVRDAAWPRNAIDRFILAALEAQDLHPLPPADRLTLLRRVTFDLTGLPPTPDEIDAFLGDVAPDAYERAVERLLASPAYGERWATSWLDLARYADTDGFEQDTVRTVAWRYRDWVIDAANRDLPYDQFLGQQLAADELSAGDEAALQATGFLRCGPDMPDINLQDERRHMLLNEMTATVGAVFLGLQMGCAQCHDHKFDPLSQADFYRLRAVLEPCDVLQSIPEGRVLHELPVPPESRLWIRGDFRRPGPMVEPAFPRIANPWGDAVPVGETVAAAAAEERFEDDPIHDDDEGVREDDDEEGDEDRVADEELPATTSGRRSALAAWLARPDHPLTSRVMVNRLWQGHFGRGLVGTPSDFGRMGEPPTHPELLDWLATEFIARGWSIKSLHRLIVTSATYRTAGRPSSPEWDAATAAAADESWSRLVAADPDNRLLGRMPRRRLEGEAIRDALLAVGGGLVHRGGGPGVMPPLPAEVASTLLNADQWIVSRDRADHRRRSVYLFVRRNLRYPLFEAFDGPDTQASCPRRNRSVTAPQALWLLHGELAHEAARDLATVVHRDAGSDPASQTQRAFLCALSRPPDPAELQLAVDFLTERSAAQAPSGDGLADLCLALLNANEFVYVD